MAVAAMSKIWRTRVEAGTQILANCPSTWYDGALELIKEDYENGYYSLDKLKKLVVNGNLTEEEYKLITDEEYVSEEETS